MPGRVSATFPSPPNSELLGAPDRRLLGDDTRAEDWKLFGAAHVWSLKPYKEKKKMGQLARTLRADPRPGFLICTQTH